MLLWLLSSCDRYVYGGSFTNGDSSLYSEGGLGGQIVTDRNDILFVVFNYRLGIFGHLARASGTLTN